ncbi:MAG: hypothetical protein RMK74_15295 [Myxococcales bacterium]|nr:hypothetical protein [Myxococcales bacterium]
MLRRRTARGLGLGCVPVLVGCGASVVAAPLIGPPRVRIGALERAVVDASDPDEIRDVSARATDVWVATDRGVLVYTVGREHEPQRITRAQGLVSDDVHAVAVHESGRCAVATSAGLVEIEGGRVTGAVEHPPAGRIVDLAWMGSTLWACGDLGLARRRDGQWARIGERAGCTTLVSAADGVLWVGTTSGLWRLQQDVVREHAPGHGIPEPFVRDVVPLGPDRLLALLVGPAGSVFAHWDGRRWYAYTIAGLQAPAVGLVPHRERVLLVTPGHSFVVRTAGLLETSATEALHALSRSEPRGVLSYRARERLAEQLEPETRRDDDPLGQTRREPVRLVPVPENAPTVSAPAFGVAIADDVPPVRDAYLARASGGWLFVADGPRGLVALSPAGARAELRSRDLVDDDDLQLASDVQGQTWLLARDGSLVQVREGRWRRFVPPGEVFVTALAGADTGAYVAGAVRGALATVRVYRIAPDGLVPVVERALQLPGPLVRVPFMGVEAGERFWLALEVDDPALGRRMRGAAVISARDEAVTYHHRAARRDGPDGPGALTLPDEISTIDLNQPGMAWFATLSGAVRLGDHQAVVFGEARGVRGEIVTDVAVGTGERVWVAAAEGLGFYENRRFHFAVPAAVQSARPTRLAIDGEGNLWCVGPRGGFFHDGRQWHPFGRAQGLPTDTLRDVEVDATGRVWLLAEDRLFVLTRR